MRRAGYGIIWAPPAWPPMPSDGVVDANCRVHGMTNLYIAGSSVFPTVGNDMPTLTVVALAHRLADHLKLRADQGRRRPTSNLGARQTARSRPRSHSCNREVAQ